MRDEKLKQEEDQAPAAKKGYAKLREHAVELRRVLVEIQGVTVAGLNWSHPIVKSTLDAANKIMEETQYLCDE